MPGLGMDLCLQLSLEQPKQAEELPDPTLFFTWYCEKARELERVNGSIVTSLQLLDTALAAIGHGRARLAKRFINATKTSLLRYHAYLLQLEAKLDDPEVSAAEKASILQVIRTIDLREYERRAQVQQSQAARQVAEEPSHLLTSQVDAESSEGLIDWAAEYAIFDLIAHGNDDEALCVARESFFFPQMLLNVDKDPSAWLLKFCEAVLEELKECDSVAFDDDWTDFVAKNVPDAKSPIDSNAVAARARKARDVLKARPKPHAPVPASSPVLPSSITSNMHATTEDDDFF